MFSHWYRLMKAFSRSPLRDGHCRFVLISAETVTDVREIQKSLKAKGLALASEADESTPGPASLMLTETRFYRSTRRQPAELEEQNGGKNANAADLLGVADFSC